MSTSKHIDKICCIVLAVSLLLTVVFMNAGSLGVQPVSAAVGYASRLFNTSIVHTIDIVMDDWDSFIENCTNEEYADCTILIDGEAYRNVAIRAKGNTSLSSVASYGSNRYSFKIEFDHYDNANSYYGLDKLCLNNIIQDNTYMKDYLIYQLMRGFGADAPLCSFSYITVNGDDWGLYLAVEGIEDAFLQRCYGNESGQLYKPDSMDMGGGRGNGRHFNQEDFNSGNGDNTNGMPQLPDGFDQAGADFPMPPDDMNQAEGSFPKPPDAFDQAEGDFPEPPDDLNQDTSDETDKSTNRGNMFPDRKNMTRDANGDRGMFDRVMGSNDVALIYTDDEFDSYSNIFDNAKTDLSDTDKARLIASLKKLNNMEELENVIDIDEVLRYFVVHNFVLNFDSYTGTMMHNYYLYEQDGQLSMIPWDYNLAFGSFEAQSNASSLVNYPIDTPVSGGTIDSRPMLAWIFSSAEYTELYHTYFSEFTAEYYDNGTLAAMIDSVKEMIAPYVESDPTKFCTYEEFEKGVETLRSFCLLRAESVSGQLDATIPSTSDGQAQDSSSLIDASDLAISDMGNMNNKMNGSPFRQPPNNITR